MLKLLVIVSTFIILTLYYFSSDIQTTAGDKFSIVMNDLKINKCDFLLHFKKTT